MNRRELINRYYLDHREVETTAELAAGEGFFGLRLDGKAFHSLTEGMVHPFDAKFEAAMNAAGLALLRNLDEVQLIYIQSDEISAIFPPSAKTFGRRLEKLTSISAAVASVAFSEVIGKAGYFDARLLNLGKEEMVLAYLAERQQDAYKNSINLVAYWGLRQSGLSGPQAESKLRGIGGMVGRIALVGEMGLEMEKVEDQRKWGRLLNKVQVGKVGLNPLSGKTEATTRRQPKWNLHPPRFERVGSLRDLQSQGRGL